MTWAFAVSALIGYLLGSSNMALYVSKLKGIDLRQIGSKNLGTCNTFVGLGLGWAALVFLHDAGKAALAVILCRWVFPDDLMVEYIAGSAAVIGHVFPFYLHFRGGKGFAAYLGMMLIIDWRFALVAILVFAILTLATNYIVIGTVAVIVSYPVFTAFSTHSVTAVFVLCIATAVVLYKHRENFVRIANGTEIGVINKKKRK